MPAYNPGTTDQSGSYLYEGLSGFSRGLGAGLDKMNEHRDKMLEEDKRKADLFKSLVQVADLTGVVSKDKAMTMDLPTLQGVLEGTAAKKVQNQQDLQEKLTAAQLQRAQAANKQEAAQPGFNASILGQMQPAPTADAATAFKHRPVDMEMIMRASRDSGYNIPPNELDNVIRAVSPKTADKIPVSQLGQPVQIPGLEGHVFVPTSTGGGEIRTVEGATVKPAPVEHEGKTVGYMLGKDFVTKEQLLGPAGFTQAKDEKGRPIANLYLNNRTGASVKMTPDIISQILNPPDKKAATGAAPVGDLWKSFLEGGYNK